MEDHESPAGAGEDTAVLSHVKHYPDLSLAAIASGEATSYRVWLAARLLDPAGSGWCWLDELRGALTDEESPLHCMSWRRLRQILAAAGGRFWTREEDGAGRERLRYTGVAALCGTLDVARLAGKPQLLPAPSLAASLGDFKAALLRDFHAGRADEKGESAPITRRVLAELAGVSEQTTRNWDRRARVEVTSNYLVEEEWTDEGGKEAAWEHGAATFRLQDKKGRWGAPGRAYVARQIPNSYQVARAKTAALGRQRKVNQSLKQREHAREQGARADDCDSPRYKIFHANAAGAARSQRRRTDDTLPLWRVFETRKGTGFWVQYT